MKIQSLTPNIGVKSVDETVRFYVDVLGFKLTLKVPEKGKLIWAMVSAGQINLMFQDQESLQKEYPELKGLGLHSVMSLCLQIKDKDQLYKKVCDTKYLAKDINTTNYGEEEFAIRDNNGFILTISEYTDPVMNYDNYFLPTDDYNKSKKFYTETLGLKVKFEFEQQGMIAFCVGNEEPAIILKDKRKFPNVKPTVWVEVADVRVLYTNLVKRGVNFLTEPFKIRTGWAVEFTDPSGNAIGLADYVI